MMIRQLNPRDLYDPAAFGMSQATVDERSGFVFVSGQVAWDVDGRVAGQGYAEQTARALQNLSTVLEAAGCRVTDVVSVRVYLRGEVAEHLPECGPILAESFGPARPALTGIGVASLATRDTLVEIEAIARMPVSV